MASTPLLPGRDGSKLYTNCHHSVTFRLTCCLDVSLCGSCDIAWRLHGTPRVNFLYGTSDGAGCTGTALQETCDPFHIFCVRNAQAIQSGDRIPLTFNTPRFHGFQISQPEKAQRVSMQKYSSVEHICLSSEPQQEAPQQRITNRQFDQYGKWVRSEAHFLVFNEHHIAIRSSGLGEKPRNYELDLTFLDSQPKRMRRVDWPLLLLALSLLATGVASGASASGVLLAAVLLGAVLALGAAFYRSHDRVVYFSKHGRAPLLVLLNRNPDARALQEFLADLSRRIQHTRQSWTSRHDFLCAELREHRRLHEEGIFSEKEYERIKRRILKKHSQAKP